MQTAQTTLSLITGEKSSESVAAVMLWEFASIFLVAAEMQNKSSTLYLCDISSVVKDIA
ncbi:hypothetical protein MTR_3g098250 [Medicago truncatula]|uniref:Uncharacterized protein n=1 Tax=Medicago truncatula TaxID=3880 RepID=G7J2Q0_MEDTR|nr:hypothetical protein MTR_3g098250 [Medicago truncatula]